MHYNKYNFFTYVDNLNQENIININQKVDIILRNYNKTFKKHDLANFVDFCKKNKRKIYLSNDIKRAKSLNFDGVYIPSFNKLALNYNLGIKNNFTILGSAHNIKDILIKNSQKIDIIFISPLFENNENKKHLGIVKFNLINKNFKKRFIALGGINKKNECMLKLLKINGYAAIREFRTNK